MNRWGRQKAALFVMGALMVNACSGGGLEQRVADTGTPAPSPSKNKGLCQPFPDRLIDDFVAYYNGRSLDALKRLVTAPHVIDVVAAAYAGDSLFEDVEEWAQAGWDAGDRLKVVGYGAFSPTKHGFQMQISRGSRTLREHGIDRVSTTLDAISDGCTIISLVDSGPVQAKGYPCAFYDVFGAVEDVGSDAPESCLDGSADQARTGPSTVFTGEKMLVWGGHRGGQFTYGDIAMDGLSFDPVSSQWTRIPPPDLPDFRPEVSAWTGMELIVFGSKTRPDYGVVGVAYDPDERSWRTIVFPYKRGSGFEGVWTGEELVLWGGPRSESPPRRGAAYNPSSESWHRTAPAPIGGRWWSAVAWTGTEMIVWGGTDAHSDLADGAAYNPATDTWRRIAPAPISARQWLPITWTGTEVIAWGGSSISRNRADGAAYNPATDSWRILARSPLRGRHYHSATWTGEELIVFGGYNYRRSFSDGAAYDPVEDKWRKLPRAPIKRRFDHSAIWTGSEMVVFGGTWDFGHIALGDGATYDPISNRWRRLVPD